MSRPTDAGRRVLGLVVVALLVAAVALWGASRGTWLTAVWSDPLRGTVPASASGAETEPILVPWALLALAAVAGVLATAGWGRRVVGAVVALAGLVATWRAVAGLAVPPPEALPAAARRPGTVSTIEVTAVWPLLALLGALVLLAVGVVVTWRAGVLPRLGARYDAPGAAAPPTTGTLDDAGPTDPAAPDLASDASVTPSVGPSGTSRVDPDRQLWDALDQGRDPTVADPGAEPAEHDVDPPPGERAGRRGGRT